MARKRMISPSFWENQALGRKCSFMERLLFLGLISNADDEGLGHGNPSRIGRIIFQYDDALRPADVEKGLNNLEKLGFIRMYEVDGDQYYCVLNFLKHQTINKATPSKYPRPPWWKGEMLPLDGIDSAEKSPQDQLPDDYRNATVGLPPKVEVKVEVESEDLGSTPPTPPGSAPAARGNSDESVESGDGRQKRDKIDYQKVLKLFSELCPTLPEPKTLSDKRKKAIRLAGKALKEFGSTFTELFRKVDADNFYSGRSGEWDGCDLNWVLKAGNIEKILERKSKPSMSGQKNKGTAPGYACSFDPVAFEQSTLEVPVFGKE